MKRLPEHSLKLRVTRQFRLPELPGSPIPARTFTSTYYDTPDLRLTRMGVRLCRHVEHAKAVWQLGISRTASPQQLEIRKRSSSPPTEFTLLLFAYLRGQALAPVAKLRVRRSGVRVRALEGPIADVLLDRVHVLDGNRTRTRFFTVEVQFLDGNEKTHRRLETELRAAGAGETDARPTLLQALEVDLADAKTAPPPSAPAADHLKVKLKAQTADVLAHDPGTRLGTDPEDLHQMRVATRRTRAFLRAARPMLVAEWANALRSELAWLGRKLGPVRDADVLLGRLEQEAANLTAREQRAFARILMRLKQERAAAHATMLAALQSDQYLKLLDRLGAAVEKPQVHAPDARLSEFAAGEFRKLRKAMRGFSPSATDEALHRIRIRTKRARYAAELAETSIGKPATQFIRQAKSFQDILGEHQDSIVAEHWLRDAIARTRAVTTTFAVGRIVERLVEQRREARALLPKAWKKLERRGQKAWAQTPRPRGRTERPEPEPATDHTSE